MKIRFFFLFYLLCCSSGLLWAQEAAEDKQTKGEGATEQEQNTEQEQTETPKNITIHFARVMKLLKAENPTRNRTKDVTDSSTVDSGKAGESTATASDSTVPTSGSTAPDHTAAEGEHITSETAQKTVNETKDTIIFFSGEVSISIEDRNSVFTIQADTVICNQSENTIEASGNVHYTQKTGGNASQEFDGELFLFNTKDMEGVFIDGTIKQATSKKDKKPFTLQANIAGRDASGTIGFKNGVLSTNTDKDEDPLWSIRASRIWLLPGNELAILNGYFSIGVVPLLYLPVFYHPADEMIFHPVFGVRSREGAFVQTTTYLVGRKPLETKEGAGSSFASFMQGDTLKKQEQHGLFLKNLDEDEIASEPTYVKLVADAYSMLGGLIGVDGSFVPKESVIKNIDFSWFFGMSRTLYPANTIGALYSTYDYSGTQHYNYGSFYGVSVPFRYRGYVDINIIKNPIRFSVNMVMPSDPYFKRDFFKRSEDMNWFSYAFNIDKLAKKTIEKETSYAWKVDGSLDYTFKKLSPWITAIKIPDASLLLDFLSKSNQSLQSEEAYYAPQRDFFYPRLFKPSFNLSIEGTLLSNAEPDKEEREAEVKGAPVEGIVNPFETPSEEAADADTQENSPKNEETERPSFFAPFFPLLKPLYAKDMTKDIAYAITYNGDIKTLQETTFATSKWKQPEDIQWTEYYSRYFQIKGSAELKGSFSYGQDLVSASSNLVWSATHQRHPWLLDQSSIPTLGENDYKASVHALKNENKVTVNPFIHTELFKPISCSWTITEILVKNKFSGTYASPRWDTETLKWDKDFITEHVGTAVFGMVFANQYTQKLTFSAHLPPRLPSFSTDASVTFLYGSFVASTRVFEKEKDSINWHWDPLKTELKLEFPYQITMSQSYSYNIEEKKNDKLHFSLSWQSISAFYTHSREIPYELKPHSGWITKGTEKQFIPFAAGLSFSNISKPLTLYTWKNRMKLQLGLASNVHLNLVRITDSYFTFSPKVIFNIHEFWDLSFSSTSRNDVIARYFQKALHLPPVAGKSNMLVDLIESFYFWDRSKRAASGFKLRSLEIGLVHYLKDWILKFNCEIKPQQRRTGNRIRYEFAPTISFLVEWNPISDIKVQAKKKDNVFSVDRGEFK
ncbi:MAG: LPS-assembly protein LptD [Treponema sp.]